MKHTSLSFQNSHQFLRCGGVKFYDFGGRASTSVLRYLLGVNDKFGEVGSLICENLRHLLWNILKAGSIRHRETEYHAVCVLLQCLQYEYRCMKLPNLPKITAPVRRPTLTNDILIITVQ